MQILKNQKFVLGLYVTLALIIGLQQYYNNTFNNFTIFQHSVFHFFAHINPYLDFPNEQYDVFLYNPSFTILFIPFAYLPTVLGIVLWAIFISLVFYMGIKSLPISDSKKLFIYYLIIPELTTSIGNLQTNPIVVALIIFTMTLLDKNSIKKAAIFPSLNFFIKGYGAIAGVFFLLKNPKIKHFIYLTITFIIIGALPLLFYSFADFIQLYEQWYWSLKQDYSINTGISAMGFIKSVFYKNLSILNIQLFGVLMFAISFISVLLHKNYEAVKFFYLANVLIWVIIFNQSSESATYIIASTGVFIWFVNSKKSWLDVFLFVFFFILTVMSPSDLFPREIRQNYIVPYSLKALPCILIWLKIQGKLLLPNLQIPTKILWKRSLI